MGHGTQVVDLIGLHLVDDVHEVGGVGQVTIVELQAHGALVAVAVDVVDALGVEARRSTDDTVHLVALQGRRTWRIVIRLEDRTKCE